MKEPNAIKCMLGSWNSSNYFDNKNFDLFYREGLRFEPV
jgi:SPX domain protein involved in polyphosphate accumulation